MAPSLEIRSIEGACSCGAVTWRFLGEPEDATACNCTRCRRLSPLWAYDFEQERIFVDGATSVFAPGESLGFHFCPTCGCLAYWRAVSPGADGRRRIAVNLRLADPAVVGRLKVERFDGLQSRTRLPYDGRTVSDYGA